MICWRKYKSDFFNVPITLASAFSFTCSFPGSKADFRLCLSPPTIESSVANRQCITTAKHDKSSRRKRRPPGRATQFELLSDFPPSSFFFPEISWRCYLTDSFRRLRSEWQAQTILIWWFIPCDLAKTKASLFWETHQSISQLHFLTARQLPHASGYHAWTAGCSSPRCWPPRGEPAISDQNKPPPRQPISGKKGNKIHYGELV